MTDKLLLETHADGVVTLTFNRPQMRNALDLETMRAFAETVQRLTLDGSLRVLVLTGAGQDAFCSGGDLVELSGYSREDDALYMITLMGDALLNLERLAVPVIAAINGYALGGGGEIALACDMRIADERAQIGFVQIHMALTPGWGGGQRLMRLVGYAKAMEILLEGRSMSADELMALGLVNRVVPVGTAFQQALALAHHIAQRPPNVVRAIKTLLQAGLNQPYRTALQTEREVFPSLWAAEAHLQAVQAFMDKRNA